MAVAATDVTSESLTAQLRPRLFTVDDIEGMVRSGILHHGERVELIEGQIVEMHAMGTRHIWAVNRLCRIFNRRDDVQVSPQNTLELHNHSGPEPDIVVLSVSVSEAHRPTAGDTLLVVEVADTSLVYDRQTKGPLYARAGVPEYWLVDLNDERIEQYREPSAAGYRAMHLFLRGETLSPVFAPDLTVQVDDVLGPPATPATD